MQKKKRIDIMGTAMYQAMGDMKSLMGIKEHNSDTEENIDR